MTLHWRN